MKNTNETKAIKRSLLVFVILSAFGCVIILLSFVSTSMAAVTITTIPNFSDLAPTDGVNLIGVDYAPQVVDYDQDGLLDIFFNNHRNERILIKQMPLGIFSNVADVVGLGGKSLDNHGSAWGDCNNDNYLDLYINNGSQQENFLFVNQGDNTFAEEATPAGVNDPNRGKGSSWVDYDKDGDLDLFIGNARDAPDVLFRNDGDCTFTNVSASAGDLTSNAHRNGLSWADYDNDGDLDVFSTSGGSVGGSTLDANSHLYRNNGNGTFTNVSNSSCLGELPLFGIAWGDYDNDGDQDLFVTRGFSPGSSISPAARNSLFQNNIDGTFTDVTSSAGVEDNLNSHHAAFTDFDNDGDLDLYVTNAGTIDDGNLPNFLYENLGGGSFQEVASEVGATGIISATGVISDGISGGMAIGDINSDGFPDIVISHGLPIYGQKHGPREVLINQGNDNHWLQVKLVGTSSNYLGIGARIELTTPDGLTQIRDMNGGIHNFAQDELVLMYGLGSRSEIESLTVRWPSGVVQRIGSIAVDQRITIIENRSVVFLPIVIK